MVIKKGITPVITVMLLMLIAVAMIGVAFIFFQNTFQASSGETEQQVEQITTQTGKTIKIDNAVGTLVAIRHIGSRTINSGEINIFNVTNGAQLNSANCPTSSLAPGSIATCTITP